MKNVLLYGFRGFGDFVENPSERVVKYLDETGCCDCKIHSYILDVTKECVDSFIEKIPDLGSFDLILGIGLNAKASELCLEKVAVNLKIRDLVISNRITDCIIPNAENAYISDVNCEEIVDILLGKNIPACVSYSAGTYMCNYSFYLAHDKMRAIGAETCVGFVHIPLLDGAKMDKTNMSFNQVVDGIKLIINHILSE